MILIEHQELASAQASITFSDIPQDYTDLYLVVSARINTTASTWASVNLKLNGSTANFSVRNLQGSGSGVSSYTDTAVFGFQPSSTATASTFGSSSFYIPNYTSSNYKSVSLDSVMENNATESYQNIQAGLWSVTDAVTSLTVYGARAGTAYDLMQYSSATLYGITKGSDGVTSVS